MGDLVKLAEVNSATVLHALRMRYEEGEIYTAVGPILVATNPFEPSALCSDACMLQESSCSLSAPCLQHAS